MQIAECSHKVTGNGYEAMDGCEAVDGYEAEISVTAGDQPVQQHW